MVWALLLARRPISTRALSSLAVAVLLGVSLAAPVLVPFLRHLPAAQRLDELAYSRVPLETLDWSPRTWFLPRDAPLLQAPLGSQVFGRPYSGLFQGTLNWAEASAGYAGLVALAGCALALAGRARRRAAPFLLTSALGLVVAAGFVPLRAALAALPGAGLVATGRLLPLVVLGLCVAGALGWSGSLRGGLVALVGAGVAAGRRALDQSRSATGRGRVVDRDRGRGAVAAIAGAVARAVAAMAHADRSRAGRDPPRRSRAVGAAPPAARRYRGVLSRHLRDREAPTRGGGARWSLA